jgi:hypothetical protein
MLDHGVIVGCDQNQEWLLSWWWQHYSAHNNYPVVFADFGMSSKALAWCKEKGHCISACPTVSPIREVPFQIQEKWESTFGKEIWLSRPAWFKKPLACLQAPFSINLWLDLDCKVNGTLEPLLNSLFLGGDIALVREPESYQAVDQERSLLANGICYNSGVIVFVKEAPIIQQWADLAVQNNELFITDQHALSRAIFLHHPALVELPATYNWVKLLGPNEDALIHHYTGGPGKAELLKEMPTDELETLEQAIRQNAFLTGLLKVHSCTEKTQENA